MLIFAVRGVEFLKTCRRRVVSRRVDGLVRRGPPSVWVRNFGFKSVVGEVFVIR